MYESTYRTILKRPYHRSWHDLSAPQAKAGYCTVTGGAKHRAEFSILVRSTNDGHECWLAACAQHVPPMAQRGEPMSDAIDQQQ